MSDDRTHPDETTEPTRAPGTDADAENAPTSDPPSWNRLWQAPVLVGGALLLVLGIVRSVATTPDPSLDPLLDGAEALIEAQRYEEAIGVLNTRVYPWVSRPEGARESERIRYHIAKARAIGLGQKAAGFSIDANHENVIREYARAEEIGAVLGADDLVRLAHAHLGLGNAELALAQAERLGDEHAGRRLELQRAVVGRLLDRAVPDREQASGVLADMLVDPALSPEDTVWALERSSILRLEQGYVDETITRILRAMPRLKRAGVSGRSRLHLILSRSYLRTGALEESRRHVGFAEDLASPADAHYPGIMLVRANLEDVAGNTRAARDLYSDIVSAHSRERVYPLALLGLGETEALLGEPELAMEAYRSLVEHYGALGIESEPSRERITRSLSARVDEALSSGEALDAIAYTEIAERLYTGGREVPPEVLEMSTRAHTARAEQLLGAPIHETRTLLELDPSTRAEVQRHLLIAASNARVHAERFVVDDIETFADSLWRAADLFDRAGDHREAIQAFRTYADTLTSDDRHAEARFRLAEALRSTGEFEEAAAIYQKLIEDRAGMLGAEVGIYADESLVPLAQAYLYDEDPGNDAEAEQLLERALDGSSDVETELYRSALLELAEHYDATGRAERAIERYEEYASRYQGDARTAGVVYKLADAHRRLANRIESTLDEPMPAARRTDRVSGVRRHRERAIEHYEHAIEALSALGVRETGLYEATALRNAYFYLADCHYDLGRYDEAIRRYDIAKDRYAQDPASLVAMIQIVNAYLERGQLDRARTANERAERFYNSMPSEVWDDPDLPMDRADWERWLSSSSTLLTRAPAP